MSRGAAFAGLIHGLNEGISTTRAANQRESENEIAAEQSILSHLAQTSENKATQNAAIQAMLNIHETGKPTGFLGKLLQKRSSNNSIADLIHGAHPDMAGEEAAAPPLPSAPPPPAAQALDVSQATGGPSLASVSPAPSVPPLPSAPEGPAAQPINTTSQHTPISFTPPGVSASTPPPAPQAGSVAPPPGPDFGVPTPYQKASALAGLKADTDINSLLDAGFSPEEARGIIRDKARGASGRTAAAVSFRTINELGPKIAAGTATPAETAQYNDAMILAGKQTSQRDKDLNQFKVDRDAKLASAREKAQGRTIAAQMQIAQSRIAAARANHQESVALGLEKELRSAQDKFAKLTAPETNTLDSIEMAKPAIEDVKRILTESGLKDDNSLPAAANTRLQNFLYSHGIQEPIWSNLNQEIAFLNLPTARQYMQGRPNQKIYEDIMAHLPNPKTDTPKQMFDKLENIDKFSGYVEEGINKAVDSRVARGMGRRGVAAGTPPPSSVAPPDTVTYLGKVTKFSALPPEVQAQVLALRGK